MDAYDVASGAISSGTGIPSFEVTVAKPRKRPVRMGGTDASVFAMQGVPTIGFREEDVKGYTKENSILP